MKDIIAFDYDGVIADSLDAVIALFNDIGDKYGLEDVKTRKEFVKLFDRNFFESLKARGFSEQRLKDLNDDIQNNLKDKAKHIDPFPDIGRVLKELSRDHKLMVVTSNMSYVVREFLKHHEVDHIEKILGADHGESKVKKIGSIISEYPDSKVYYIGDTAGDIEEGRQAGAVTIAATWGFHDRERLEQVSPDHIVDAPADILDLFQK